MCVWVVAYWLVFQIAIFSGYKGLKIEWVESLGLTDKPGFEWVRRWGFKVRPVKFEVVRSLLNLGSIQH